MAPRHSAGPRHTPTSSPVLALVITEYVYFTGHPEWSDDPLVTEFGAPDSAYWLQTDFHALDTSPAERTAQSATTHLIEDSLYDLGIAALAKFPPDWDSDAFCIGELRQLCMAGSRTSSLIARRRQADFLL